MPAELREELRGRALWLILDRPAQRNALSFTLLRALADALARADANEAALAICLSGAGEQAFCAGMDLAAAANADEATASRDARRAYAGLLAAMAKLGKPLVAHVNGAVMGGGMGLLAACDLAVCADDARFGTPEVGLGIFPYMALAPLSRCVGRRAALELCFTGRKIDAAEAVRIGLVNRSVPRASLHEATNELLTSIWEKSPVALRLGRRAFYATQDLPYEEQLEAMCGQLALNLETEDAAEGARAFLEKRKPVFKGR